MEMASFLPFLIHSWSFLHPPVFLFFFPASRVSHLGRQYCPSPFWGLSSWMWHCLKLTPQRGRPVHHFGEDSQVDSLSPHCSQDFWLFGSYFCLFSFLSLCFLSTAQLLRGRCKKVFLVWFLCLFYFMTIYADHTWHWNYHVKGIQPRKWSLTFSLCSEISHFKSSSHLYLTGCVHMALKLNSNWFQTCSLWD